MRRECAMVALSKESSPQCPGMVSVRNDGRDRLSMKGERMWVWSVTAQVLSSSQHDAKEGPGEGQWPMRV